MLVGVGGAWLLFTHTKLAGCVLGAVAAVKWLIRAPDRAQALDRAARGLGKTLWFGPFKINFYGRSA